MSDAQQAAGGRTKQAAESYVPGILTALAEQPGRIALHWRGREITAREVTVAVSEAVHTLRGLGAGPGKTVAVLVSPNSPYMLAARYAAHLLGAAVTYIRSTNPGSTAPVLSASAQLRILLDSATSVLFADAENAPRARELAERAPGRFALAVAAEEFGTPGDPAAEPVDPHTFPPRDPDSLAVITYSSGSTGEPKGVCQSARLSDALVSTTVPFVPEPRPRLLAATPLNFVVGQMADVVLTLGGTVFLHEGFDARRVLEALTEHRITRTFMATPHLYQLLDLPEVREADLSSLRALLYTGVAAAPARIEEAVEVLGPVLLQVYGSAEGGRISVLLPPEHRDLRLRTTVGRPFPEVEIAVRDLETARPLPAGEVGEVWVRSPNVMDGYLGDPAATARALRDGWYRTGDIGSLSADGYLTLVDRVADVVKTEGVKVYPAVVEREIAGLPGIAQAAVYGVRDADRIEHVHAAVVVKPGAQLSAEEVRKHVAAALSPVHAPEEVRFLDALPLGVSGKPDKRRLRQLYPVA